MAERSCALSTTGKVFLTPCMNEEVRDSDQILAQLHNCISGTMTDSVCPNNLPMVRTDIHKEIVRGVLSKKLSKMRHLVIKEAIHPAYLDEIFPGILKLFKPQVVTVSL